MRVMGNIVGLEPMKAGASRMPISTCSYSEAYEPMQDETRFDRFYGVVRILLGTTGKMHSPCTASLFRYTKPTA
jgi:hypothetical protein